MEKEVGALLGVTTRPCPYCGNKSILVISESGLEAWRKGTLIQEAFPELSAAVHTQLATGVHPECWAEVGEEEL